MSIEKEAKKIEDGANAVQSALNIPIVKYVTIGVLAIVVVILLAATIKILF